MTKICSPVLDLLHAQAYARDSARDSVRSVFPKKSQMPVTSDQIQGLLGKSLRGSAGAFSEGMNKVVDEPGDVFPTIAQGWESDGDDVYPIKKIQPKSALLDQTIDVSVGC